MTGTIENLAELIPRHLVSKSGSVFYSGPKAFEAACPLYLLGLNPGGDPDLQHTETIQWHTSKVLNGPDDWSEYRDESWAGLPPGTCGMQPRVLHLIQSSGLSPGSVPASNLVFVRSQREAGIKDSFNELADSCWPFHQAVLNYIGPKVIVCFGKTAGAYVRHRLNAQTLVAEMVEQNLRRWQSRLFSNSSGINIFGRYTSEHCGLDPP